MRLRLWTPTLVVLGILLLPPAVGSVLAPPESGGGTGCLECGPLLIIHPDGSQEERETCLSAPFAAPLSGRTCKLINGDCKIEDFCYFA